MNDDLEKLRLLPEGYLIPSRDTIYTRYRSAAWLRRLFMWMQCSSSDSRGGRTLRGKSFSPEVRDAADLYLDVPVENEPDCATWPRPQIMPRTGGSRIGTKPLSRSTAC